MSRLHRLRGPLSIAAAVSVVGGALMIGPGNSAAQPSAGTTTKAWGETRSPTGTQRWLETGTSTASAAPNSSDIKNKTCAGELRKPDANTSSAAPVSLAENGHNGVDPLLNVYFQLMQNKAKEEGVELNIVSGCRTIAAQQKLWNESVEAAKKAGKSQKAAEDEARRKVARWEDDNSISRHLLGRAIDVGPESSYKWLEKNLRPGELNPFGICRIYANEVWHLELAPNVKPQDGSPLNTFPDGKAVNGHTAEGKVKLRCPALLPDAASARKDP